MKRQVILSVLAAIAIFAVTTTAQAGMFGRLSVIRGCTPCEPACTEVECDPCEKAAPCEVACDPCEVACDPCGRRPFRPFGGFFANLKHRTACGPCAPQCDPCEPACDSEPACDPCKEVACDPCGCNSGGCNGPCLPFNGFFLNLKNKLSYKFASCKAGCNVGCDPCEPACDPCNPCE